MMNVFIMHTSASLTLNENADPTVHQDFKSFFNRAVPEGEPYYLHQDEGSDDLPAHIKSSLLDSSLNIPIAGGQPRLGAWQGIYLVNTATTAAQPLHRGDVAGRVGVTLTSDFSFLPATVIRF